MPLKPLTMNVLQEQTRELAISKDAETAALGKESIYSLRLSESPFAEATAHETFMVQVGFYLGHIGEKLGLNKEEVVSGLQAWTQEVFGMDRPPIIPYAAQIKLGLGDHHRNYSRRTSSRGFSRSSWEDRGSRSNSSRPWASGNRSDTSSYSQRPGSYGSTSYGSSLPVKALTGVEALFDLKLLVTVFNTLDM